MYRDLSAQLAAKELELTEAREKIDALEQEVARLIRERSELLAGAGNRDAVLKNAVAQSEELRMQNAAMEEELTSLRETKRLYLAKMKEPRASIEEAASRLFSVVSDRLSRRE